MMSEDGLVSHELVSALADGQLGGDVFARALASLADSDEALAAWHSYHLVGDALRCAELADGRGDMAFVARLRDRLPASVHALHAAESQANSEAIGVAALPVVVAAGAGGLPLKSANDPVRRWKLLAGATSMLAVAVVGWSLAGGGIGPGGAAQLAGAPAGTTAAADAAVPAAQSGTAEPPVMLRDARLDELLAAHKQFGGTSALQMPAGFLRNATFENPGR